MPGKPNGCHLLEAGHPASPLLAGNVFVHTLLASFLGVVPIQHNVAERAFQCMCFVAGMFRDYMFCLPQQIELPPPPKEQQVHQLLQAEWRSLSSKRSKGRIGHNTKDQPSTAKSAWPKDLETKGFTVAKGRNPQVTRSTQQNS